jgi:hypothetical protein
VATKHLRGGSGGRARTCPLTYVRGSERGTEYPLVDARGSDRDARSKAGSLAALGTTGRGTAQGGKNFQFQLLQSYKIVNIIELYRILSYSLCLWNC